MGDAVYACGLVKSDVVKSDVVSLNSASWPLVSTFGMAYVSVGYTHNGRGSGSDIESPGQIGSEGHVSASNTGSFAVPAFKKEGFLDHCKL